MKSTPTVLVVWLAASLAAGQKFQEANFHDATAKGAPVSMRVKTDPDLLDSGAYGGAYGAVRNNSDKGILAFVAIVRSTDEYGQVTPCTGRADFIFKSGVMARNEERFACLVEGSTQGAKVTQVEGQVIWVQFDDSSTWGNTEAGQQVLAARPKRLAFLTRLVDAYYQNGEEAFDAMLNDQTLGFPEFAVAGCLKSDADAAKIAPIELAKKRLADALEWHAQGIF
jgi:hypothetical protein